MSDAFVPVDLDKLLDDFEEQDSSASVSSRTQSAAQSQGTSNGTLSTDDCRIGKQLETLKTLSVNVVETKTNPDENCDLVSNATASSSNTNETNSTKAVIDLLSTDVNACDNSLSSNAVPKSEKQSEYNSGRKCGDSQCLSTSEVVNLLNLADMDVTPRPSIPNGVDLLVNVELQSDPTPPDITNDIANKAESQGNVGAGNGNLPHGVQEDLLLLDFDNPIDSFTSSNSCSVTTLSGNAIDKNVLYSCQPCGSSLLDMPLDVSSQKHTENSLIDLTTEDSRPKIPISLFGTSSSNICPAESTSEPFNQGSYEGGDKKNEFYEQRRNFVVPKESSETSSGNQTLTDSALSKTEDATGITGTCSDNVNVSEFNSTAYNIASAPVSNMPHLTGEGESALPFLQDHFGNYELARDMMNNSENGNSLACVNNESNTQEVNNSQCTEVMNDRQQTTGDSIPVGQDAVGEITEASNEPFPVASNYEVRESEQPSQLGYTAPAWLPDSEVNRCMNCQCKFTMVKRRHHCRACGKIYCSLCCNLKFNLQYLEDKPARVCQPCANILLQRQAAFTNQNNSLNDCDEAGMYLYLNPNDQLHPPVEQNVEGVASEVEQPPEYEETEVQPSVQPSVPDEFSSGVPVFAGDAMTESTSQVRQFRPTTCSSSSSVSSADIPVTSTIPLPPVLMKTDEGLKIDESPNHQELLHNLKKKKETVMFLLNKHLVVKVKIVKLNCCVKRKCWCFSSEGMQAADQEDMVILLECVPKESSIPQDVLSHFNTAYRYAKQGHRVTDLGYTIFGQPFLGSLRNAGFLYVNSSFQCLENLVLPSGPHIFGILIQREEVSWVQLFPIRLILRLGAEYRYYPCPLWSVRDRQPMYGEIGHTIMDLLADFKNFQYTLPRVTGMHVHIEDKKVVIQLPQNRYDEVLKVLNATDEYVMAFEATFSNVADSHLVCIQEGTNYKTQSINLEGQERKVTGASFIVFNGALKSTTELKAKISIVEDGVMVQMIKQLSEEMRQAMRGMSDFTIHTGLPDTDDTSIKQVVLEWVSKQNPDSQSVLSPIDGLALGTTSDIKINTHFDFSTPSIFRLRWTELFFLGRTGDRPARSLPAQFKQTTADIAKACTVALRPYLYDLYRMEKRRIGLRVDLNPDMVGYTIGSQGSPLPDEMSNNLDNELVPAIQSAVNPSKSTPSSLEFLFNIVEMLS